MNAEFTPDAPFAARSVVVAIPSPESGAKSLTEQLQEVTQQIQRKMQGLPSACVFQQTVFLRDYEDRAACQEFWRQHYGKRMPAIVYVPQAPCEGQALAVEAILAANTQDPANSVDFVSEELVVGHHYGITWYFAAQQTPPWLTEDVYEQSVASFRRLNTTLLSEGVEFDNVIRTWLYIGNITEPTFSKTEGETQRYKELNRARTDFFRKITFFEGLMPPSWSVPAYPASTGIGGNGNTLVMSALAVKTDSQHRATIVPLENPQQVSAFDYGAEYSPKSPKFSRALLLASGDSGVIFVSGTASITNAESRFDDEPIAQTNQTMENIEVLIAEENLAAHGKKGFGCRLDELAAVRVYIKRPQDYEVIRDICEREMPNVQKIYTFSDVCRPELLVEIEGIAFTQQRGE